MRARDVWRRLGAWRPRVALDAVDVLTWGGLVLVGTGVGLMSVPWACIVVGCTCFVLGIAGARR